jgi:hypothetical protein
VSKRFELTVEGSVVLELDEIWPDGDAPENPTAADAQRVIDADGGLSRVLLDWSLEDDFELKARAID